MPAHADSTSRSRSTRTARNLVEQIGASVPQLIADAKARIDALFELNQLPRLLRAICRTPARSANHAVGVDYQPDAGDDHVRHRRRQRDRERCQLSSDEDRVFSATVVNYGIVAGVNLARWSQPRSTLSIGRLLRLDDDPRPRRRAALRRRARALQAGRRRARAAPSHEPASTRRAARVFAVEDALADTLDTSIRVEGTRDYVTVGMLSSGTLTVLAKTFAVR